MKRALLLLGITFSLPAFADCKIDKPGLLPDNPAYDINVATVAVNGSIFKHDSTFNKDVLEGRFDLNSGSVYRRDTTFNKDVLVGRIGHDGSVDNYDSTFGKFVLIGRLGTDGTVYNHDSTFNKDVAIGNLDGRHLSINGADFYRLRGTCAAVQVAVPYFFFESN